MSDAKIKDASKGSRRPSKLLPICLLACVLTVAFWEYMSHRSLRAFDPYTLTNEQFKGFDPTGEDWILRAEGSIADDPTAPTILSCLMQGRRWPAFVVRLTHGYNMPDCMRLKKYDVVLVEDRRAQSGCQLWRLVSETGTTSVWATAMIQSANMTITDVGTETMPFPRIVSNEDPKWVPRGITRESLRHPISGLRKFMAAKWNASRCDLATFLKLKRPAIASEEILTVVTNMELPEGVSAIDEKQAMEHIAAANRHILAAVHAWWQKRPEAGAGSHSADQEPGS